MNIKAIIKLSFIIILVLAVYLGYVYIKYFVFPSDERQEQLNSHEYPDAFKFSFIKTCIPSANEALCQCALNYYQSKYTYAEYVKVGRDKEVISEMNRHCLPQ